MQKHQKQEESTRNDEENLTCGKTTVDGSEIPNNHLGTIKPCK